jgi:hypothetical protein
MNAPSKDMLKERSLFDLYGLQDVLNAAKGKPYSEYAAIADAVLPFNQARAFKTRWSTMTDAEQKLLCNQTEEPEHG